MGGSGKTVLVASTLRKQYDTDSNLFSDGIFWLNIGNLQPKSDCYSQSSLTNDISSINSMSDLNNQLLLKMELLAEFVRPMYGEQLFPKFDQLDTAIHRLKRHFEKFKRSLLVLDDVWNMEVLERFQFGIPIVVTTRESTICPRHFIGVKEIPIVSQISGDVFSIDESLALLYKCLSNSELVKMDHLKENIYVIEILKTFKGLPFCIPLISNCMEHWYKLTEESSFGLQYKLMLENDNDDIDLKDKIPCYSEWEQLYKDVVKVGTLSHTEETHKLVNQSILSLDDKLKDRLYDFVIFFDSVPFVVFQTLWSDLQSENAVMEVLMKLVAKSLIIKTVSSKPLTANQNRASTFMLNSVFFSLHNITFNFLKSNLKPDEIKVRIASICLKHKFKFDILSSNVMAN